MSHPLSCSGRQLKKLGLTGWRMQDAVHPISVSGWLGKHLAFLPSCGWSRRFMYLRTIKSCTRDRRMAGERSAVLPVFIAALIGVGATFVLRSHGDQAKEIIRSWAPPLGQLLSASTTKSPQTPASAAASPELVQQLDAMTHDVADMRNRVEQFAAKQEQTGQNIETLQAVEQDFKRKMSSLAPQTQPKLSPVPDTRPTTIPGWMLREVVNGMAVLQGPNGIWRVTHGDTVPGVGRVNSIVLWATVG